MEGTLLWLDCMGRFNVLAVILRAPTLLLLLAVEEAGDIGTVTASPAELN